jgi:hypothetical protein
VRRARPLQLVLPPIDDPDAWRRLLNLLYLHKQDELFRWAQTVRKAAEQAADNERAA